MKKYAVFALSLVLVALIVLTSIVKACDLGSIDIGTPGECNATYDGRNVSVVVHVNGANGYKSVIAVDGVSTEHVYSSSGSFSYDYTGVYGIGTHNVSADLYRWVETPAVTHTECSSETFSASHQVIDVPAYYIYADKVVSVPGYNTCPANYSFNGSSCQTWVNSGYTAGHWPNYYWVNTSHWEYVNPTWIPDVYGCPSGYSDYGDPNQCRMLISDTYRTETFGPINFQYEKSNDPNKCHLPTGSSLGVPSWAMSDFNQTFPEWKDGTIVIDTPASADWVKIDHKDASFPVDTCNIPSGNASVEVGECVWDVEKNESYTQATITLDHAAATLDGNPWTGSVSLTPGTYSWSWAGISPYVGSGGGTIEATSCKPPDPGSATVEVGSSCLWVDGQSVSEVTITTDHAKVSIVGLGDYTDAVTVIQKPSGEYGCTWTATAPYVGGGDCSFTIVASCEPDDDDDPTPVPTLPIPSTGNQQSVQQIIPVTGANRSGSLALGLASFAGLGLVFAALKKLIK